MHKRVEIPSESKKDRMERYKNQRKEGRYIDYFVSKVLGSLNFHKPRVRWAIYKVYMRLKYFWFKLYNRIEVKGRENVPEKGAIFLLNHFGKKDVILFMSAFAKPVSCFTAVGKGLAADILEHYLNFVPRRGTGKVMIEKMVRTILKKTKYMAMWPEGTVSKD